MGSGGWSPRAVPQANRVDPGATDAAVCQGAGMGRDAVHAVLRAEAVARLFADRVLVAFEPSSRFFNSDGHRFAGPEGLGSGALAGWADPARSASVHRLAGRRGMHRRGRRRAARRPGGPGVGIVGAPTRDTSGRHPATRSCQWRGRVTTPVDDAQGCLHQTPPGPASPAASRTRPPVTGNRLGRPSHLSQRRSRAAGRVPWPAGWTREARRTSDDCGSSAEPSPGRTGRTRSCGADSAKAVAEQHAWTPSPRRRRSRRAELRP